MADAKPEQYWVDRGEDVIADLTLEELRESKQIETYRALCKVVMAHGVKQVCDLGCNTGAVGKILYDEGYEGSYRGIDSNHFAIDKARAYFAGLAHQTTVEVANVRRLPLETNAIECATMKDVLEHMEDFRPGLGEAFRVANRIVIVANFICWEHLPPITKKEPTGFYHNRYNKRAVTDFAKKAGWVVGNCERLQSATGDENEVYTFVREGKDK